MARRAEIKICPCCKRPLAPKIDIQGKVRRRYFDFVAGHPEGVTTQQIVDAVYGDDPNGGPTAAAETVRTNIYHINKALKVYGLKMRCPHPGRGAVYRLVRA